MAVASYMLHYDSEHNLGVVPAVLLSLLSLRLKPVPL